MANIDKHTGKPSTETDREHLLDFFLQNLAAGVDSNVVSTTNNTPFNELSLDQYPEVEVSDFTDQKIVALQKMVTELEAKCIKAETTREFKQVYKLNYAKVLNPQQLMAVASVNGPLLVIAGAGSGKTHMLAHRVCFLIENGVLPTEILLLTFTRKAAKEMLGRVQHLLQDDSVSKVTGGTFHSFANHSLRKYAQLLGLHPSFTIIDSDDSADTIDLIRTELKFNTQEMAFPKKDRLHEIFSTSKNRGLSIREVIESEFTGLDKYVEDIELVLRGYTQYKKICQLLDYDDLLEFLRNGLRDNPVFRKKLQEHFRYIMVDEFQDTNIVQKEIVDLLASLHRNVMVVGDDAQSIYSFRGANYENILRFPENYPDCKIIKIEENYRSNQGILDFTNSIIDSARICYKKKLYTQLPSHFSPTVHKFYDQETEASYIVSHILRLRELGVALDQIAVLCRAFWHCRYIELELNRRGIPYVAVGGLAFNERMHVKDIIAYLRIIMNPYDAVAWHRVLKLLPGVGNVTAGNIVSVVRSNAGKMDFSSMRSKKFYEELNRLARVLTEAAQPTHSIATMIQIIKEYYTPILKAREPDYEVRLLDINALCELATKYDQLDRFLSEFALDPPSKRFSQQTAPLTDEGEEKGVVLSTIHSAKGLEWYAVFVPHCLDGLIPSSRSMSKIEELEEERRLFYVACSRAKQELYITMPSFVDTYNGFHSYPSRFLVEVDKTKFRYEGF